MSRLRRLDPGLRPGAALAGLAMALGITVALGVADVSALDVTSAGSAQGRDIAAGRAAAAIGEGTRNVAHGLVRHLYVYDGDLTTQDAIAADVTTQDQGVASAMRQLETLLRTQRARTAFATVQTASAQYEALMRRALAASRSETVAHAGSRGGSRRLYTDEILPLLDGRLAPAVHRLQTALGAAA
jgi:hypothetical protein